MCPRGQPPAVAARSAWTSSRPRTAPARRERLCHGQFHGAWPHEADRGGRAAYSQLLMLFTIAVVEMP
jgi:hypothetical protein